MIIVLDYIEIFFFKIERFFQGSKNEFRQQFWGLGTIPSIPLSGSPANFKKIWHTVVVLPFASPIYYKLKKKTLTVS